MSKRFYSVVAFVVGVALLTGCAALDRFRKDVGPDREEVPFSEEVQATATAVQDLMTSPEVKETVNTGVEFILEKGDPNFSSLDYPASLEGKPIQSATLSSDEVDEDVGNSEPSDEADEDESAIDSVFEPPTEETKFPNTGKFLEDD